jgi:hypothetical protein
VPPELLGTYPGGPYPSQAVRVAESTVRGECGWHIAPVIEETLDVDHAGGSSIVLPSLRIVEVAEVRDRVTDTVLAGWDWSAAGILTRPAGWPPGPRAVRVTLAHGHDTTPPELIGMVAELAAAFRSTVPGTRSESRTVGGVATARTFSPSPVLSTFAHVLDRYRVRVPT